MIPVLKRGTDKLKAESYRPVSLSTCVGKLMERLINTRLMWHLEDKKHITPEQAAFRQDRSTEDQITYIAQAIENAFQGKKHTFAVWIDLEKAFDKVWKEGLKLKLPQCGVAGRMFKWIGQYMHNRKAKVQIKQHLSKKRTLRQGVSQGGVLSPTLFLIFLRDILHSMPQNIQGAICADDLALWCSEEYITTANYRLQQALQVIESWARPWLVKEDNFHNLQPLQPEAQCALETKWANTTPEDAPTYLGVTLDRRLTWQNQLQKNQARAKIRLALMKKLSCTEWGADQNVLYVGRIRPVLEYGMATGSTAAKSNSSKLSRVQHQAMRLMTGVMWSTPISAMETVTGLQPLEDRQEIKVLTQAAKFKRLQDNLMHERMNQPKKGTLKRSNLIQHSRILERRNSELLDHMPKPIPSVKTIPSWKQGQLPRVCTKVPGVTDRGCQPEPERKSLTLEYVNIKYPDDQWTHAYTDGSTAEATRDRGGGVYIRYNDGIAQITIATGKYSTNFKAEAEALKRSCN